MVFLYPLKTSEKLRFFDSFEGYRKKSVTWNELTMEINFVITCWEYLLWGALRDLVPIAQF